MVLLRIVLPTHLYKERFSMGHKIKPKHKFVNQTCIHPSVEADEEEEEYYNIEGIIF